MARQHTPPRTRCIYGQNPTQGEGEPKYTNILQNGLTPFDTRAAAFAAQLDIECQHTFAFVSTNEFEMVWAEPLHPEEIAVFQKKDFLVVIAILEKDGHTEYELFGAPVTGVKTFCGMYPRLTDNGIMRFSTFEQADRCRREVARIMGITTTIGTFR